MERYNRKILHDTLFQKIQIVAAGNLKNDGEKMRSPHSHLFYSIFSRGPDWIFMNMQ